MTMCPKPLARIIDLSLAYPHANMRYIFLILTIVIFSAAKPSFAQWSQSYSVVSGGHFVFQNLPNGAYRLTAQTGMAAGGVTAADAHLIFQSFANPALISGLAQKAADANGDGVVDALDTGLIQSVLTTPAWRYQNASNLTYVNGNMSATSSNPLAAYNWVGDLNGDGKINVLDLNISTFQRGRRVNYTRRVT